jgi:hydrogenase expression/formation protein HypC
MCLGIPGKVVAIEPEGEPLLQGAVRFGGITKKVCLAYVPDVKVGEYVIVHVGFAIAKMDEAEAGKVFELLDAMDALEEIEDSGTAPEPEP